MKKIRLALAAFVIAIVSAFAVKANSTPPPISWTWACVGDDITNPYDYIQTSPSSSCSFIGTKFCAVKTYEDSGYPFFTTAIQNDLTAIKNGTNPTSNTSGAIRFRP
ncbi:DUF6520 family protein [Chitinophaga sp.]|uniref:DUF6520 family protein n=1 Tax=Chitinophaga sp. TaxID=1869181 RepID=UPI002F959BD1